MYHFVGSTLLNHYQLYLANWHSHISRLVGAHNPIDQHSRSYFSSLARRSLQPTFLFCFNQCCLDVAILVNLSTELINLDNVPVCPKLVVDMYLIIKSQPRRSVAHSCKRFAVYVGMLFIEPNINRMVLWFVKSEMSSTDNLMKLSSL